MQTPNVRLPRWAGLALFVGGLLLALFWTAFTLVHGPTSSDQGGAASRFWSAMLAVPDLLVAAGVLALRPRQPFREGTAAWAGYTITVGGLVLWALCDLAYFVPIGPLVTGIGLILFAVGGWRSAAWSRGHLYLLLASGLFMSIGTLGYFRDALAIFAGTGDFRLFGVLAYFVPGLIWMALGLTLRRAPE